MAVPHGYIKRTYLICSLFLWFFKHKRCFALLTKKNTLRKIKIYVKFNVITRYHATLILHNLKSYNESYQKEELEGRVNYGK